MIIFTGKVLVRAEDATEDDLDDDDAQVEAPEGEQTDEETTEEEKKSQGSPDIDVTVLFTKPEGNGMGKSLDYVWDILGLAKLTFFFFCCGTNFI